MIPSVSHPTDRPNLCTVKVDGLTLTFSYSTPIAFEASNGTEWVRATRRNDWGPTTGRHLAYVDGGGADQRARRVPGDIFEEALAFAAAGAIVSAQSVLTSYREGQAK